MQTKRRIPQKTEPSEELVFKNKELYIAKAKIIKALAHPTRLWMVEQLANGKQCVCKFVDAVDADFSTISKHLTLLKQAGIIKDEKIGKKVYYSLLTPCLADFSKCIENILTAQIKKQSKLIK